VLGIPPIVTPDGFVSAERAAALRKAFNVSAHWHFSELACRSLAESVIEGKRAVRASHRALPLFDPQRNMRFERPASCRSRSMLTICAKGLGYNPVFAPSVSFYGCPLPNLKGSQMAA